MANVVFKLRDSGFSREQVEALTEFMSGSVVTKEDIANLDGKITSGVAHLDGKIAFEIANLRGEMKKDTANLDGKIISEIANLRGEMKEDIAHTDGRIIALEGKVIALNGKVTLLCWMFGILIILIAGGASLVAKTFFG